MAGGTWLSQNKSRPGAYINFKGVPKPVSSMGTRGVVTFPAPMSWGAKITELYSTDLFDGKSLAKIGYIGTDEEAQLFRLALKNAYKAYVYRLDTGGTKATATLGTLTISAKYPGVLGNSITISIVSNGARFDVITYFKGAEKSRQTVATVAELQDNEWVEFEGEDDIVATAGTTLADGTNGAVTDNTYTDYLNEIKSYNWNTMAIPQDSATANTAVIEFIKNLREKVGKKVQAVLFNATADYEGIISVNQGYATPDEEVSPTSFVAYIAGLTAGSEVNQSNTYHVIEGATSITYPEGITPYGDEEIIEALKTGKLVLSTRQDGAVVIEQDINTFHTFVADKGYTFSKNRVIRTLDEINNSVGLLFSRSYLGKVDNDESGRTLFKGDVIAYMNRLQELGAIQNFNSATDINVFAGEGIDAVVVELAVQPVDSMEKLYMTVMVG